jgi:hypothetical protein
MSAIPSPRARGTLLDLLGLTALFTVHFWAVKASNMGGYEWPNLHLASRGIISFPHANRPLTLLWHLLPAQLWPHDLRAYLVTEWLYLVAGGWLLYALVRRLAPEWPGLALLAGAFALTWVPMDHARLQPTVIVGYAGSSLGILALLWLYLESWRRDRRVLLTAACLGALLLARIAEAVIPPLAVAPLLLPSPRPWVRLRLWLGAWFGALLAGVALVLPSALGRAGSYQSSLRFDPDPTRMGERWALQFGYHLSPLLRVEVAEMAAPAVALAAALFALLWWRSASEAGGAQFATAPALATTLLGLLSAGLAYAAFVPAAAFVHPVRTQILAAPGIAVALSGLLYLLARRLPPRAAALLVGLLGTWVVAVGTGRTLALQRDWDTYGRYPVQRAVLAEILRLAPDVRPHTLIVLLDPAQSFPAMFPFRHAIEYLYARRASGLAWGVPEVFYPFAFGPAGVTVEPVAALREPWEDAPTTYGYHEIVAFARSPAGLQVLESWPAMLPPLPPGARYEPRARIVATDPGLPSRALLRSP